MSSSLSYTVAMIPGMPSSMSPGTGGAKSKSTKPHTRSPAVSVRFCQLLPKSAEYIRSRARYSESGSRSRSTSTRR